MYKTGSLWDSILECGFNKYYPNEKYTDVNGLPKSYANAIFPISEAQIIDMADETFAWCLETFSKSKNENLQNKIVEILLKDGAPSHFYLIEHNVMAADILLKKSEFSNPPIHKEKVFLDKIEIASKYLFLDDDTKDSFIRVYKRAIIGIRSQKHIGETIIINNETYELTQKEHEKILVPLISLLKLKQQICNLLK